MCTGFLNDDELEDEARILAEHAYRKAESDAYYQAMEDEYWEMQQEAERQWRESQISY